MTSELPGIFKIGKAVCKNDLHNGSLTAHLGMLFRRVNCFCCSSFPSLSDDPPGSLFPSVRLLGLGLESDPQSWMVPRSSLRAAYFYGCAVFISTAVFPLQNSLKDLWYPWGKIHSSPFCLICFYLNFNCQDLTNV